MKLAWAVVALARDGGGEPQAPPTAIDASNRLQSPEGCWLDRTTVSGCFSFSAPPFAARESPKSRKCPATFSGIFLCIWWGQWAPRECGAEKSADENENATEQRETWNACFLEQPVSLRDGCE